jgi:hypothetical protein
MVVWMGTSGINQVLQEIIPLPFSVTAGEQIMIAPGSGGVNGRDRVAGTGGGSGGTNALGLASGGTGGAAGENGNSGAGGGAASVVELKSSPTGTVLATFYGAGAGGGGGGNNTLAPTPAGEGGTSPGLNAGQYQASSSTGAIGAMPKTLSGGTADGGGGGGGGLLGGLTTPGTIRSFYDPGTGLVKSLLGCIFCNASILSQNGSGEHIGQGGNRGSNGYVVESGQSVTVSNIIDTTYSKTINYADRGTAGPNGYINLSIPVSTGITFNGTVVTSAPI